MWNLNPYGYFFIQSQIPPPPHVYLCNCVCGIRSENVQVEDHHLLAAEGADEEREELKKNKRKKKRKKKGEGKKNSWGGKRKKDFFSGTYSHIASWRPGGEKKPIKLFKNQKGISMLPLVLSNAFWASVQWCLLEEGSNIMRVEKLPKQHPTCNSTKKTLARVHEKGVWTQERTYSMLFLSCWMVRLSK